MTTPTETTDNKVVKVTVNLYQSDITALEQLAAIRGVSRTMALREAIATQLWFKQRQYDGGKILMEKTDGQIIRVEIK